MQTTRRADRREVAAGDKQRRRHSLTIAVNMNNMHLPSSSRSMATAWNFPLGIEGFRYADLNRVRRLMALYQVFRDDLRSADPDLADRYEHSCECHSRGAGQEDTPLLIDVARHLDRFI